ncbi:NADPH-ferredoxin reductase FprA [Bifidobacterium longum subsp. infantis]|uniref:ferredoxin--NADP(+) reductase n=1 Tax=Bifidobacterium longum subsp. infantis TaxID=1682 RepID=A0A8U0L449_BIFLI|nr:NADPH-ferredoxin reductase FprA [Bifidobacterium longum subsp. infantis]VWQ29540.1 NADPH-ferredoxin reductase FprA [Bifidobacterium longum subsp. infantis]VWQ32711.1 NADPH-ferredoxin reductase FprA [Bifidobacterium longum subsp. infantis]VWQ33191.1 NADPH-ferredoxin reductase FprA [Bifidobacterium longum subsp. infantis]
MMTREFTDSEIRYLRSLRAVDTVTPTRIIYSSEFKKRFLREYLNGKSPSAIFRDAGLPNVIVGRKRIERCTARWAKDEREEHDTSLGAPDPDSENVDMLLDETRKLVDDLSAALLRVERIIDMLKREHDQEANRPGARCARTPTNDPYRSGRLCARLERVTESVNTELRIAVIGAGPAGVYSSDIFLRQLKKLGEELGLGTEARIDLFEKLPVPFGLVRYGVAPDHPSIKFIASALEKTLDNPNIHLYCDVEFGKDVTLDDLLARYDAVLFATGAVKDKPLNLPGADLEGVYGAAKFVEWYDGYPTGAREWPLTAENVAVIGGGNVAMDVARELMRNADDLKAKTDIPDNVYEGIGRNKAKVLHLFIRRGVAQAKFSVQELREMEKLPGVQLIINEDDFELDDDTIEMAGKDKLTRQMVEELFAIREMAEDMQDDGDVDFEGNPADRRYYVHFNSAPTEILGEDGKVKAIRVERTETGADGRMHRTGEFTDYPVEAVYHAIGYRPAEAPGIAYDEHGAHLANANGDGRVTTEADGGEIRERLYATGWAKRGPVGLIGSTKSDALAIVTNMLEDLAKAAEGGRVAADRDPESIDRLLAGRGVRPIDFAGWKKVDAFERAEGAKEGREHKKVIDPEQMRELAHA